MHIVRSQYVFVCNYFHWIHYSSPSPYFTVALSNIVQVMKVRTKFYTLEQLQ